MVGYLQAVIVGTAGDDKIVVVRQIARADAGYAPRIWSTTVVNVNCDSSVIPIITRRSYGRLRDDRRRYCQWGSHDNFDL
jgi:hypothetical protein